MSTAIANLVRRLAAAGASAEAIAIAVDAVEAEGRGLAERRRNDRERKRRQRAGAGTASSRDRRGNAAGRGGDETPSPKKERSPTPPKEKTTPSPGVDEAAKNELARVLAGTRADAVVAHRKSLRKPLSAEAARLLAGRFARCADPNAAAETMIASGWTGFEPEWLERRAQRQRPHTPQRGSWTDALAHNHVPAFNERHLDD